MGDNMLEAGSHIQEAEPRSRLQEQRQTKRLTGSLDDVQARCHGQTETMKETTASLCSSCKPGKQLRPRQAVLLPWFLG